MSIRAVFFDLDQTLIDDALARDLSIEGAAAEVAAGQPDFDLDNLRDIYKRVSQAHWLTVAQDVQRGAITGDRWGATRPGVWP